MKKLNKNMLALSLLCANLAAMPGCISGACEAISQCFFGIQTPTLRQQLSQEEPIVDPRTAHQHFILRTKRSIMKHGQAVLPENWLDREPLYVLEINPQTERITRFPVWSQGPHTNPECVYMFPWLGMEYYNYQGERIGNIISNRTLNDILNRFSRNANDFTTQPFAQEITQLLQSCPDLNSYKNLAIDMSTTDFDWIVHHVWIPGDISFSNFEIQGHNLAFGRYKNDTDPIQQSVFALIQNKSAPTGEVLEKRIYPIVTTKDNPTKLSLIRMDSAAVDDTKLSTNQQRLNFLALIMFQQEQMKKNPNLNPRID